MRLVVVLLCAVLLVAPSACGSRPTKLPGLAVSAYYYPWYGRPGQWQQDITDAPVLGKYDGRDSAVLQKHFQWARDANLDFLTVSWPGPGTWEDGTLKNHYLKQPNSLPFAVIYESAAELKLPSGGHIDFNAEATPGETKGQLFLHDMEYLADTYLLNPDYYRLNGRPVIVFYLVREWRHYGPYVQRFRQMMAAEGIDPYLVADVVWWSDPENAAWNWTTLSNGFDAITGYSLYDPAQPTSTDAFLSGASQVFERYRDLADAHGLDFTPSVMPGFDDRNLRGTNRPYIGRTNEELYRRFWEIATRFASGLHPLLFVTSFNEWHEGTEIEPSSQYGTKYLSLTAELVQQSTR